MKRTAIIILNWNSGQDAGECLSSLRAVDRPEHKIYLVDNHSTDGSLALLSAAFPEAKVIGIKENLGFAAGNNVGIRAALLDGFDQVLLLNNDTAVKPDCLAQLARAADIDARIGIVGPKIYFFNSQKLWFAGGRLDRHTGFTYHEGEGEIDRGQYDREKEVDFVSGCAMLIKREVVEKIGTLDPDYYHSHEDADFCLKAIKAGFKVYYEPRSVIYHKLARSSGGRKSPFYLYYRTRNHLIFNKKQKLGSVLFWPVFFSLVVKRVLGSLLLGQPKGALATMTGIYDYYAGHWAKGSGDKFR
jgi:GT2 family glycosyltransferase